MTTLGDWLAIEPFTLTMSSGFFGFFAHAGMMEALEEARLLPRRITGSSAGALVGGVWASGLDAPAIADRLLTVRRADFWDPGVGFGLLRGELFDGLLRSIVPRTTIEETRVPLAIVVHDVLAHRAVARTSGLLAPTIRASCAVPGLFHPVWLDGRPYLDGGILDRPGITPLARGERTLYHHLVSRSPWRTTKDMVIPRRASLTTLAIDGLPRLGPFRLEAGAIAYQHAKRVTKRALALPIVDSIVRSG